MGFSPETYAIVVGKGGKANGFATLNENGKVPASQIPSVAAPITSDTETTLTGVLTGNGNTVGSKAIDTSSLTDDNDHIPTSGVVKSALVGGQFTWVDGYDYNDGWVNNTTDFIPTPPVYQYNIFYALDLNEGDAKKSTGYIMTRYDGKIACWKTITPNSVIVVSGISV